MKRTIIISEFNAAYRIRSIVHEDIEILRLWKNNNKEAFFHQNTITRENQELWFTSYQKNQNDVIFMIESKNHDDWDKIGCFGYRVIDGDFDIYNVMRGVSSNIKISDALYLLFSYLRSNSDKKFQCRVLNTNPALQWYRHIGFKTLKTEESFSLLEFDESGFTGKKWSLEEL